MMDKLSWKSQFSLENPKNIQFIILCMTGLWNKILLLLKQPILLEKHAMVNTI